MIAYISFDFVRGNGRWEMVCRAGLLHILTAWLSAAGLIGVSPVDYSHYVFLFSIELDYSLFY